MVYLVVAAVYWVLTTCTTRFQRFCIYCMCNNPLKNELHVSIRKPWHRAITKLVNDGARFQIKTMWLQNPHSLPLHLPVSQRPWLLVRVGHVVVRMEEVTWEPLNRSPLRTQKSPCYQVSKDDFLLKLGIHWTSIFLYITFIYDLKKSCCLFTDGP